MKLARVWLVVAGALVASPAIEGAGFAQETEEEPGGSPRDFVVADTGDSGDLGSAGGFNPRLALRYVTRPMTLPQRTLVPEVAFTILGVTLLGQTETVKGLAAGVNYGVVDNFTIVVAPIVIAFDPKVEYANPLLAATYRFLPGNIEVGASFLVSPKVRDGTYTRMVLSVPVHIHGGDFVLFRTGLDLELAFREPKTITSPAFPAGLVLQVADPLAVAVSTGLVLPDGDFDLATFPLGFGLVASLAGEQGPAADLIAEFGFPAFLRPGSDDEKIITEFWQVNFAARVYVFL